MEAIIVFGFIFLLVIITLIKGISWFRRDQSGSWSDWVNTISP